MNNEFTLKLADTRLLQTWHLLNTSLGTHHDHEAISDALDAIHTARASITQLVAGLNGSVKSGADGQCCA